MFRTCLALAAALLAAACAQPAPQDLTAHYSRQDGRPFAIEAAASGDTRIVAGDETYYRIGGVDYVVLADARGRFVAREEDLLALLGQSAAPARPQPDYAESAGGEETVAGVRGKVWRIHPREVPSITSVDAVIATDPALAPAGKGVAAYLRALIVRNSHAMGAPGNLEKAMIALAAKGLVLRFGTALKLERVDKAPLPAALFKLPSAPLGRTALARRLAEGAQPSAA